MKDNGVVAMPVTVPMAVRSKCIRKMRPMAETKVECTQEKENAKSHWQQLTKVRTVLLNDVLNRARGPCRNGNIVIVRMPVLFTAGQPLHPFKAFFKKEL